MPSEGSDAADPDDREPYCDPSVPGAIGYHVVVDLFDAEEAEPSWEAEQPHGYRSLLERIARAATCDDLAAIAQDIRSLALTRDQAAVAWTAWRIRRTHLEANLPIGRPARGILARIGSANGGGRELARLGTWLYRAQRAESPRFAAHEWRAIWTAYRERRGRRAQEGRGT